jgi:peptide/nickel transport system permease protein
VEHARIVCLATISCLTRFVLRRLLFGAIVLFVLAVVTYGMMRWLRPEMYPGQHFFADTKHDVERALFHLDFGKAYTWPGSPYIHDMWVSGIGADMSLVIGGFAIGIGTGVLGGVLCAMWPRSLFSRVLEAASMVAFCAPIYAVGMATLLLFNDTFGIWKVPYFFEALPTYEQPFQDPWAWFRTMLVPCLLVSAPIAGACLRLTMALTVDELESDHVRAAWAKGLTRRRIVRFHAARTAYPSLASIVWTLIPATVTNAVLVEWLYSIPGFFFTTKRALGQTSPYTTPDIPVLQALALWAGLLIVVMSVVVDVALNALDPRIRTSQLPQRA